MTRLRRRTAPCRRRSVVQPNEVSPSSELTRAVDILRAGGVVAHACEGVWGLACDAFNESAVMRILEIKSRPVDKGLIVIGGAAEDFAAELARLTATAREVVEASWPGPETWIVSTSRFPAWITGGRDSVAVRVPGHEQARALAAAFGGPLVSTSANSAGEPELRSEEAVRERFATEVDFVLTGRINDAPGPSRIRIAETGEVVR